MARITLRDYNNEIDDLIDHGQIEEAIAHSRHILTTYPKHVDTYRLLGKAYLEQKRYGDASDLLQRVLSSIPDDFISHVGMSIIREDEGNLDTAIYHMEMAFESQPSNHAIQDELRRLFEKRDGIEPPRLRLTRGALARMYAHGNLYEQAISEIMAALSEDPQRYDLQTLLAEMLHQADKVVEAAETCTKILEKLPYNLSGNRLLATILRDSERDDDAQRFFIRWQALDPYAAFINPPLTNSDQVPDDAVTVDRENWEPTFGGALSTESPAWASSPAASLGGDEIPTEIPDWLSSPGGEMPEMMANEDLQPIDPTVADWMATDASAIDSPFGSPTEEQSDDQWMSEFSTGEPQKETDGAVDWLSDPVGEPAIEKEGLTADWRGENSAEKPFSATSEDEPLPEFMKEAGWGTGSGDSTTSGSDLELPEPTAVEGEIPDWMKEMAPDEDTPPREPDLGALGDIQAEADPEWLDSIQEKPKEADAAWLGELGEVETPSFPAAIPSREADPAAFLAGDFGEDDTDDWIASLTTEQSAQPEEPAAEDVEQVAGYLAGDYGEDDTDDWLASLTNGEKGAKPVSVESGASDETVPGSESLTAPGGFDFFGEENSEEIPPADPQAAELTAPAVETPGGQEEEGLAWMESLAAKRGIAEEELVTSPDERVSFEGDHTPDWLTAASPDEAAISSELDESADSFDPISLAADLVDEESPEPTEVADHAMDWLTSISEDAAAQAADSAMEAYESADPSDNLEALFEEQPITEAVEGPGSEKSAADMGLDWLEQLNGVPAEGTTPEADSFAASSDDLADLFGTGSPAAPELQSSPDPEAAIRDELSADWMDSLGQEAEEASEPTRKTPTTPLGDLASFTGPDEDLAALFSDLRTEPEFPDAAAEEDQAEEWPQQLGVEPHTEELPQIVPPAEFADGLGDLFPDEKQAVKKPIKIDDTDTVDDDTAMAWLGSLADEPLEQVEPLEFLLDTPIAEETPEIESFEPRPDSSPVAPPEDEGLAWLEGLVENQGVVKEELASPPEERSEISGSSAPDWLDEVGQSDQAEEEISFIDDLDDLDALLDEVEGLSDSVPATGEENILQGEDDFSMDWLNEISVEAAAEAGSGHSEMPITEIPPEEETEISPPAVPPNANETIQLEERFTEDGELIDPEGDLTPEWLKIIKEEELPVKAPPTPTATPPPMEADLLGDFLKEIQAAEIESESDEALPAPTVEVPAEPILSDDDDFSMDWLEEISDEDATEVVEDVAPLKETIEVEIETPIETIPEAAPEHAEVEETVPDWLDTIDEEDSSSGFDAGLEDLSAIFGDEEEAADDLGEARVEERGVPDWLQEIGDEKPAPVPELTPEMFSDLDETYSSEAVSEVELQPTLIPEPEASLANEPATKKPTPLDDNISKAKDAIQQGDLDDAVKQFGKIIKKGKVVDQAIVEIKEALKRHPVNVELWQVLGDAYMKVNNLQDALDAYSKAENLLR